MELFQSQGGTRRGRKVSDELQTGGHRPGACGLDGRVDDVAGQLDNLIQHRTWGSGARFPGGDQAAFAKRVAQEVRKDLTQLDIRNEELFEGLRIYSETVLFKLDQANQKLDSLDKGQALILAAIEDPQEARR